MSLEALDRLPRGDRAARLAWARLVEPADPDIARRIAVAGAEAALHGVDPASSLGRRIAPLLEELDVERDLHIAEALGAGATFAGALARAKGWSAGALARATGAVSAPCRARPGRATGWCRRAAR